jgi:hypothetical protein
MGKENELQEPGDQCGGHDPDSDRFTSVQFLKRRSYDQKQQHIAEEMGQVGVSENMSEKADIGERVQ